MHSDEQLKSAVKETYGEKADQASSCCCGKEKRNTLADNYSKVQGYVNEADLGLGCGIPTQHIEINPGNTVLDLGSGAGNDVFVARSLVGDSGRVIGVDMTDKMVELAERNRRKLGFDNVEFRLGEIEDLPVDSSSVDVVLSNCVLNLVPDKHKSYEEIYRVLKPGGRFGISDIVLNGKLPSGFKQIAAMYTNCVSGAIQQEDYLQIIRDAGFANPIVREEYIVSLSDELLDEYGDHPAVNEFLKSDTTIVSITVTAKK